MAPPKTKQPREPPSVAAPAAKRRLNIKDTSRRSNACPVNSSRTRAKAATTQFDTVSSGEEFNFQGIDNEDELSDAPPPNPSPQPEPQGTSSQQDDALVVPVRSKKALDVIHFFTGTHSARGKSSKEELPEGSELRVCKLCSEKYGTDKSTLPDGIANFIYGPKTGNSNLRRHLHLVHPEEYDKAISQYNWTFKLSTDSRDVSTHNARNTRDRGVPSFSPAAFLKGLVRFVVADDQSIRVVECPEFRQLCMILCETLVDTDIPRRDKMREAVISQWRDSFEELKSDLSKSCGRISFTGDVWSNANLHAYLALTAHWISNSESSGRLALNTALIGFHRLEKKHTGVNIAKNILHLLDRANVTLKIGHFTLDNAENNATAMQELESLLAKRETDVAVDFDHLRHRVRCYAHIINICSSHIISSATSVSEAYLSKLKDTGDSNSMIHDDSEDESDDGDIDSDRDMDDLELDEYYSDSDDSDLREWISGVKRDPLRRARRVVRLLRSSDQRREGFRRYIQDGNERNWFFEMTENGKRRTVQVPELQLLRDVKTRWDSVYLMLQRLRSLRAAIDRYFDTDLVEFSKWKLTELDWYILEGLETVLSVPHACQQSMSFESTPVLSRAISGFEMFMTEWEKLGAQHKILRPWTDIGLRWAKKYYVRMDDTDAYVVTMFLNPAMRLSWIQVEWEDHYIKRAKETILTLMRRYRKQKPSASKATTSSSPVRSAPVSPEKLAPTRFRVQDSVYKRKSTHNTFSVDTEFQKYTSGSVSSEETDILQFWEANKTEFPTLFSMAMDYLPVQATSVPCERVFSSAKDTDTAKRNRISPVLMEALQMLKYSLKKERLNFMDGWPTSDAVMSGVSVSTGDLNSLFVDDPDTALDNLLNGLSKYDDDRES